ncbi:MAG: hypothetical protein E6Y89_03920, partial [Staphylococcus epidermidis]|nr:hypothetical protein [Staphylococcus epidermidis]
MDKNLSSLITIFGGTGDLSYRKLLPSIFNLYKKGHFKKLVIISTGLEDISDEEYRSKVKQILLSQENFEMVNLFLDNIFYFQQNVEDKTSWNKLKELSNDIDKKYCLDGNRLFYLAMNPQFFKIITQSISQSGLSDTNGFSRLIIEKPFGKDLKSAEDLNKHIRQYFKEEEIFRIDHYLGKEMVQNIESLRFGNTIFEPLWNNKYISNVQITLSETLGIEDRGQYYDSTGALKDMVQNHALQILTLIAMEKPESRNSKDIRLKKIELLNNIKKDDFTILTDGGDTLQGSSFAYYVKEFLGSDIIADLMQNVDYYTLGNHDFNYGYDYLKSYVENMKGKLLCANVTDKTSGIEISPYAVKEMGGYKIGIAGIVTDWVNLWERKENLENFEIRDAFTSAKEVLEKLKK